MESKLFLYISLVADLIITVCKFVVAAITGSASMVSEGVHSVIDAISQFLLIWGVKTSKRKADEKRPFGYGKDFYFWSFIVSLIIFLAGGCFSVYEGITRFSRPGFEGNATWSYVVLGVAFFFNAISMFSALKAFNLQRGDTPFLEAVKNSKDPSTFIVLLSDIGDLLGLTVAFWGTYLGRRFNNPYYDAIASIIIGCILICISVLLVRESKSLLLGETISRDTYRKIKALAETDAAIVKVKKHFSTYMAPEDVLLQLIAVFKKDLTADQVADAIQRVTLLIQKEYPRIKQLFIEPVK